MTEVESKEVEVVEEATQSDDEVKYEIIDGELDGGKVRGVRANGNVIFTVSEDFSDSQIEEVFSLANKFFNDGLKFGIQQYQAQAKQLFGIVDPAKVSEAASKEATDEEASDEEASDEETTED